MFPAAFDYRSPAALEEALELLTEHGDSAKVMAGGQSLIPLLKLRFAQPGLVIDIGRLPGLSGATRNGSLTIRALTRHADIERSKNLGRAWTTTPDAAHWNADPLVRTEATTRVSIC